MVWSNDFNGNSKIVRISWYLVETIRVVIDASLLYTIRERTNYCLHFSFFLADILIYREVGLSTIKRFSLELEGLIILSQLKLHKQQHPGIASFLHWVSFVSFILI